MIDSTGLHGDREDGQAIAGRGRLLRLRAAIGPEYSGYRCRAVHSDRIIVLGSGEFAVDVDDAPRGVDWRGVGHPPTAVIGGQSRRRRRLELTEDHSERGHRRAGDVLVGIAAAGHDYHHQHQEENDSPACESRSERRGRLGERRSPAIALTRLSVDLLALHVAIVSHGRSVSTQNRLSPRKVLKLHDTLG